MRLHRRGGRARAVVVVVSRRGDDAPSSSIDRRGGARSRSLCESTRRRPTNDDAPSIENRFRGGGASRIAFIRRAALSQPSIENRFSRRRRLAYCVHTEGRPLTCRSSVTRSTTATAVLRVATHARAAPRAAPRRRRERLADGRRPLGRPGRNRVVRRARAAPAALAGRADEDLGLHGAGAR